jgi:hypothetical protein
MSAWKKSERKWLTFKYDGLSRRIGKLLETLYGGWNLIMTMRFTTNNTITPVLGGRVASYASYASYVWGPDMGSSPYARRSWQAAGLRPQQFNFKNAA